MWVVVVGVAEFITPVGDIVDIAGDEVADDVFALWQAECAIGECDTHEAVGVDTHNQPAGSWVLVVEYWAYAIDYYLELLHTEKG